MRPLVEDSRPRLCPCCFGPVKLMEVGEDRYGYFERWECQRPDAKREFAHQFFATKERGRKAGVFILRRSDYEGAWRRRGRIQRQQERRQA